MADSAGITVDGTSNTKTYTPEGGSTRLTVKDIDGLSYALENLDQSIITLQNTYVNKDGSVAFTAALDLGNNKIINVVLPSEPTDVANKEYVDSLGDVLNYVGTIDASPNELSPFDLSTLPRTTIGAYYNITTGGYVSLGASVRYTNAGDSLFFTGVSDYFIVDNSNTEISGAYPFITVSGNSNDGYVIDIHSIFKDRITTLENISVKSVTGSSPVRVDNTDPQRPIIQVDEVTQTSSGILSRYDKVKLDGIEDGAQVNTVGSVNGYTGVVNLSKSDVGLGNVDDYQTATLQQSLDAQLGNKFNTPEGTRHFVENGDYVIDCGTL